MLSWLGSLLLLAQLAVELGTQTTPVQIEPAKQAGAELVHGVTSPYQSGQTEIRVLLPETLQKGKKYPVIYLLPVEAQRESKYGDGLTEILKQGLHKKWAVIFVAPTFAQLPWYADHPSKPEVRQETYFTQVVIPFVDKTYPTESTQRFLLGFSKSGWGAFSLVLRQPTLFRRAVAWDAPFMQAQPNKYGMGDIFGTQENFEKYQLTKLFALQTEQQRKQSRLILLGKGNFHAEHEQAHALLEKLPCAHTYQVGTLRKHDWHSGWVAEALELLLAEDTKQREK